MTLVCIHCGKREKFKSRDEAADHGWMGTKAETAKIKVDFNLCPECGSPELFLEILKEKLGI